MSTEDWKRDTSYPTKNNNPNSSVVTDVYRLHGRSDEGAVCFWFDAVINKWLCGICAVRSDHHELPGDTHEERCALAPLIARMS